MDRMHRMEHLAPSGTAAPRVTQMGADVWTVRAVGALYTVRFLALAALVTVLALGALGVARLPGHTSEAQVVTGAAMAGALSAAIALLLLRRAFHVASVAAWSAWAFVLLAVVGFIAL